MILFGLVNKVCVALQGKLHREFQSEMSVGGDPGIQLFVMKDDTCIYIASTDANNAIRIRNVWVLGGKQFFFPSDSISYSYECGAIYVQGAILAY